jgi:hypothetical protein
MYLIFSAKRSGKYFGYARMISPINNDPAVAIRFAPKAYTVENPNLPKAILIQSTELVPKGRITDFAGTGTLEIEKMKMETLQATSVRIWSPCHQRSGGKYSRLGGYHRPSSLFPKRGLRNPGNWNREVMFEMVLSWKSQRGRSPYNIQLPPVQHILYPTGLHNRTAPRYIRP